MIVSDKMRRIHLGRIVDVLDLQTATSVAEQEDLGDALVLIWFGDCGEDRIESIVDKVIAQRPLAITLWGDDPDGLFAYLLKATEVVPAGPHVMTGGPAADLRECIWTFLNATWPAEERFDLWRRYVILTYPDQTVRNSAIEAIDLCLSEPGD